MFRRRGRRIFKRRRFNRYKKRYLFRRFTRRVRSAYSAIAAKKYLDVAVSIGVGTAAAVIFPFTGISVGDGNGFRNSNKIRMRYMKCKFELDSENEDGIFYRIAVLIARTAGLGSGDLPSGAAGSTAMIDTDKWHVMYDHTYSLGDADTNGMNKILFDKTFRIMRETLYDTGAGATQVTNMPAIWVWTNDVITTGVNWAGTVRCTYTDSL